MKGNYILALKREEKNNPQTNQPKNPSSSANSWRMTIPPLQIYVHDNWASFLRATYATQNCVTWVSQRNLFHSTKELWSWKNTSKNFTELVQECKWRLIFGDNPPFPQTDKLFSCYFNCYIIIKMVNLRAECRRLKLPENASTSLSLFLGVLFYF